MAESFQQTFPQKSTITKPEVFLDPNSSDSYIDSLSATYLFIFQLVLTLIQEIRKIP